jgi:hypothetical protein
MQFNEHRANLYHTYKIFITLNDKIPYYIPPPADLQF